MTRAAFGLAAAAVGVLGCQSDRSVTAGPAQPFYERVGFHQCDTTQTRFGPAVRMRRDL